MLRSLIHFIVVLDSDPSLRSLAHHSTVLILSTDSWLQATSCLDLPGIPGILSGLIDWGTFIMTVVSYAEALLRSILHLVLWPPMFSFFVGYVFASTPVISASSTGIVTWADMLSHSWTS